MSGRTHSPIFHPRTSSIPQNPFYYFPSTTKRFSFRFILTDGIINRRISQQKESLIFKARLQIRHKSTHKIRTDGIVKGILGKNLVAAPAAFDESLNSTRLSIIIPKQTIAVDSLRGKCLLLLLFMYTFTLYALCQNLLYCATNINPTY